MPPQDLLVFLLGAAKPNRRPCPLEPTRGQLSPCGAWPDWARASCFPQPCAPSFRAHSDGRRAGTVDGHHPQHSGVSLRPPTYDLRVDATELVSTWVVCHLWTLFPVPLCRMCAQMSTNAASRTGGATKYATTSQAASTAPATAATRSPPTAGPAKVRPRMQACPGLSPRLPVALGLPQLPPSNGYTFQGKYPTKKRTSVIWPQRSQAKGKSTDGSRNKWSRERTPDSSYSDQSH